MELIEQLTLVARAIHTLEWLRDNGVIEEDADSMAWDWCRQSWHDLRRLRDYYRSQGVSLRDIDLGAFVSFQTPEAGVLTQLIEAADSGEWHSSKDCRVEGRELDCRLCSALAAARSVLPDAGAAHREGAK